MLAQGRDFNQLGVEYYKKDSEEGSSERRIPSNGCSNLHRQPLADFLLQVKMEAREGS